MPKRRALFPLGGGGNMEAEGLYPARQGLDSVLQAGVSLAWGAAAFFGLPDAVAAAVKPFYLLPYLGVWTLVILVRRGVWRAAGAAAWLWWFGVGAAAASIENAAHPVRVAAPREEAQVTGTVSEAEQTGGKVKLALTRVILDEGAGPGAAPCGVRLTVPASLTPLALAEPGRRLRFARAALSPVPQAAMRGGYDSAFFLRMKDMCYTGYSFVAAEPLAAEDEASGLSRRVFDLREETRARVRAAVADPAAAGLLTALLTNLRGDVARQDDERFRAAGLTHLLAISGSHVAMAAGLAFWLMRFVLVRVPGYVVSRDASRPAAWFALLTAGALVVFVGAPVSAQRSLMAACFFLGAKAFYRRADAFRAAGAALTAVVLAAPHAVLDPGFQMSFFAAGAIVAAFRYVSGDEGAREESVRSTGGRSGRIFAYLRRHAFMVALSGLAAGTAAAPFGMYHFGQLSPAGFLSNMIAVPLTGVFIMPPALAALPMMPLGLEKPFLLAAEPGVQALRKIAEISSSWAYARPDVRAPEGAATACMAAGLLWLILAGAEQRDPARRRRSAKAGALAWAAGAAFYMLQPTPLMLAAEGGALVGFPDESSGTLWTDDMRRARYARETWRVRLGLARAERVRAGEKGLPSWLTCEAGGCAASFLDGSGGSASVIAARTEAFARARCGEARYGAALTLQAERGFSACPHLPVLSYRALETYGAHALYFQSGRLSWKRAAD